MNRSTLLRLVPLPALAVVFAVASCESPTVGDSCASTCTAPSVCEAICPCGNASCQTYACVTSDDGGPFVYEDGGVAASCSQL